MLFPLCYGYALVNDEFGSLLGWFAVVYVEQRKQLVDLGECCNLLQQGLG